MCLKKKVCVKWKIQYDRCLRSLVEIFFFSFTTPAQNINTQFPEQRVVLCLC